MAALNPDHFARFISENKVALVDFYQDGCVPCRRLSPLLSEAETLYEGRAAIAKISLTGGLDLARQLEVKAAPTLLLFKNGEEIDRRSGALKRDELREFIETAL